MTNADLTRATTALIQQVFALVRLSRDDPHYRIQLQTVLGACESALNAIKSTLVENSADRVDQTRPTNLAFRIASLRAHGMGVREIARRLGVNASTVSRHLRRAQQRPQLPAAGAVGGDTDPPPDK